MTHGSTEVCSNSVVSLYLTFFIIANVYTYIYIYIYIYMIYIYIYYIYIYTYSMYILFIVSYGRFYFVIVVIRLWNFVLIASLCNIKYCLVKALRHYEVLCLFVYMLTHTLSHEHFVYLTT